MMPLGPTCLTPLKLAADVEAGLPPAEPLPRFADRAVCIDPVPLARQEQVSGSYTSTRDSEHFHLAWDPSNRTLDAATLDAVEAALERSWAVMVDESGWRAPDQTDTCLITVVLGDLSGSLSGTGGWTNVQEEHGVPFIVLNTDWFAEGPEWIDSLVAHEFNHASQFGYNVFWNENDWWYWESTAEWSFELPYPEANTWTWSLASYFDAPWRSIQSQVGLVNYGHFTFNVVLTEQVDAEAPLLAWEAADEQARVPEALEAALGRSMDELLPLYTAHAAAWDVSERALWVTTAAHFDTDPFVEHVGAYPTEGEVTGKHAPQYGGQTFFHLRGEPGDDVQFRFTGEPEVKGRDSEFVLTRSTMDTDGVIVHETFPTTDGVGQVSISGLGDEVTDAWVGVVPVGNIGGNGAAFSWTARVGPADDPLACACGSGGPAGVAAAAAGLALAALRRRRPTQGV
jgi:hypothetical protein